MFISYPLQMLVQFFGAIGAFQQCTTLWCTGAFPPYRECSCTTNAGVV